MKTTLIIIAHALAAVSMAQAETSKPASEGRATIREAIIDRFDEDGDGKLNEEEKAAAREAFIKRFDKNGDGKLDASERRAAKNARNQ